MSDIERIKELVGNKEFSEAKKAIREASEKNDLELIKLSGLVNVNLRLWAEAKTDFEEAVKLDNEDATSWLYLANCYEKLDDLISAASAYKTVIKLRKEYSEAYKSICVVLIRLNNYADAIEYANRGKEIDSEDYIYDFIIGTTFMKLKNFEKALPSLQKAHAKAPDNLGTINGLGTCYMALGKINNALESYQKALELSPDNPMAYFNIGSAYQIQQNHEKAVEYLEKAVELEEDESFLAALAMSEVKLEDYGCALKHYKQLALMCPDKENYKYNIVTCYEALGDYKTAISMLEGMVYINPKFILPAQKLASLYIKTNQLNKAKEIYDNIILKNKVTAELLHQYAILSSSLCDTDTAEKMLKKVIRMKPDIAKAHKDLGIIYLNKRLFNYAEEEFQTALKIAPNDFEILFEYGNYLYSISKNQEAEKYYAESLEIEPDNVLALTFMALNKLVLNQLDEAKQYIMQALEKEHSHEYVLFCAGRILFACKEYEEAKRYLVQAVELNPDVETLNTLALTYYELGEYNQALNILKNINQKYPQSVSVLMDIAKCYEKLKDNDSALEYLDKLVDIFPEHEEAHELIRKLS